MSKIKRPLALIGYTFFITGSMTLSMPGEYTIILLALFALFTILHYLTEKKYTKHLIVVLVTALTAFCYLHTYNAIFQKNIDNLPKEKTTYNGYISAITNSESSGYTVTLVDEKGKEIHNVSVYYQKEFQLGDTVEITGKFSSLPQNKYIFSNYSDNIMGKITVDTIEGKYVDINGVKYKALTLKRAILDKINGIYKGETRAVAASMGYSDKHLISDKVYESFVAAGIIHALTVSGFHVGVIVIALQMFMHYLPFDKRIKNIVVAAVILLFMNIIGFTPSIVRAGTVAAVILICANFRKEQDSLTTLAMIGLISILQNPYITKDIGAMLSYAASTGIVITNGYCIKHNIRNELKTLMIASAAVVFTMPILALAGMYATWLSPLFNLILTIPVSVICILSVVTPLLEFVPILNLANPLFVEVNNTLINSLLNIAELIKYKCSFALVNLSHPAIFVVSATAFAMFAVACVHFKNKRIGKFLVITVSIAALLCYNLLNYNTAVVTVFDSGREASLHISAKGKEYLVLSERITEKEAKEMNVSVTGKNFEQIYYCPKDFEYYADYSTITNQEINVEQSNLYVNDFFSVKSEIDKNKKMFTVDISGCRLVFGHGKTVSDGADYYILGNDKPESVEADEIYIWGNIPSWMEVDGITSVSSDLKIKINLKTGKHKTVKDVYNFGYWL